MVERPWFYSSTSLVHNLLTHRFEQRSEGVDKVPTHLYVAHQPPCYRCTYALLLYLHSALSSVQPAITPAAIVATQLRPTRWATIHLQDRRDASRLTVRIIRGCIHAAGTISGSWASYAPVHSEILPSPASTIIAMIFSVISGRLRTHSPASVEPWEF